MSCHLRQLGACKCQALGGVLLLLFKLYRSAPSLLFSDMRLRG